MANRTKKLSRRRFLRGAVAGGAGYALSLPLLECMLNSDGSAFADGSALPVYYGTFFWGCGMRWGSENHWNPPSLPGNQLDLSTTFLQPLTPLAAKLNVITGYEPHARAQSEPHSHSLYSMLTGGTAFQYPKETGRDNHIEPYHPSLDVLIANYASAKTRLGYPAIHTAVRPETFQGKLWNPWIGVSWNGYGSTNQPVTNPHVLHGRILEGLGIAGANRADAEAARQQQVAILDQAYNQHSSYRQSLGKADQDRLEEFYSGLSNTLDILKNPPAVPPACQGGFPLPAGGADDLAKADQFAALIGTAMQCDTTRVFTMAFTMPGTTYRFPQFQYLPGSTFDVHDVAHNSHHDANKRKTYDAQIRHMVAGLNRVLTRLDAIKLPNGQSVLDRSVILATSDNSDGNHNQKEHPILVAGLAGGRIRGGQHIRKPGANMAEVGLSILQAAGLPQSSFGADGAETSTTVPGLLV